MTKHILKIKNQLLLAIVGISAVSYGCADTLDQYEESYLDISSTSYTLASDGNETYTINVVSSVPAWALTIETDWIKVESRDTASVTLKANANTDLSIRSGNVVFKIPGITRTFILTQSGTSPEPEEPIEDRYHVIREFTSAYMSAGGIYVLGIENRLAEDESLINIGVLIEVATGETTEFDCTDVAPVQDVADNGTVLFGTSYYQNGTFHDLAMPSGFDFVNASAISADGSVIVGVCNNVGSVPSAGQPAKWTNGVPAVLEVPAKSLFEDDPLLPMLATMGYELPVVTGGGALGCSADGSVVYGDVYCGRSGDSLHEWGSLAALSWDSQNKVSYIGADVSELELVSVEVFPGMSMNVPMPFYPVFRDNLSIADTRFRMSTNGRYITPAYQKLLFFMSGGIPSFVYEYYPCVADLISNEAKVLLDNVDSCGLTVSDDGIMFTVSPYHYRISIEPVGYGYDFNSGQVIDISSWLKSQLDLTITPTAVNRIGTNGNVLGSDVVVPAASNLRYRYWYATK